MSKNISIKKRNGKMENFDINKIHKVLEWATEGIDNVSISEIEMKSSLEIQEGTSTKQIHDILISTTSKLIDKNYPNYQDVASRLSLFQLRKEVYGQFEPTDLLTIIKKNIKLEKYDSSILESYSEEEINYFNSIIDHNRDFNFTYAGIYQFISKYLVKDRVSKKIFETPQIAYVLISMFSFFQYEKEIRKKYVKDFYDMLSNLEVSLPTPILAGLRTPTKQFSSCVLLDCDDSLDSIIATNGAIIRYASQKAGLGINVGRIRSLGSSVKKGEVSHTGLIPFIQMFEKTVHSVSQGGVRKGSATLFFPIWHLEIESLIMLKGNRGTEETSCKHLDYSVQFNKLIYERIQNNFGKNKDNPDLKKHITLFSPHDVPDLYEAFFKDQVKFKELYEKYEKDSKIRKKIVNADDLFSSILIERNNTGRIYIMNVDHSNTHSSFIEEKAPIYQSNLCVDGKTLIDIKYDNMISKIEIRNLSYFLNKYKEVEVLSYNEKTKINEFKKITDFAQTSSKEKVLKIFYLDKNIICTPDHKVYTRNRGYVKAKDLIETDELVIN